MEFNCCPECGEKHEKYPFKCIQEAKSDFFDIENVEAELRKNKMNLYLLQNEIDHLTHEELKNKLFVKSKNKLYF